MQLTAKESSVVKGVKTGLKFFTSLTTQIAEISPEIARAVRRSNFLTNKLTSKRINECEEFIISINNYIKNNPNLKNEVLAEMLNGNYEGLKNRGIEGTDKVRDVMDLKKN